MNWKILAHKERPIHPFQLNLDNISGKSVDFFASIFTNPIFAKRTIQKESADSIVEFIVAFEKMQMSAIDDLFCNSFFKSIENRGKQNPSIKNIIEYMDNLSINLLKLNGFDFQSASKKIINDDDKEYWAMNAFFFNEMYGEPVQKVSGPIFKQIQQLWMASIAFMVEFMVDSDLDSKKADNVFNKLRNENTMSCTKLNMKYLFDKLTQYKEILEEAKSDLKKTKDVVIN